jgi:hypothetical protein
MAHDEEVKNTSEFLRSAVYSKRIRLPRQVGSKASYSKCSRFIEVSVCDTEGVLGFSGSRRLGEGHVNMGMYILGLTQMVVDIYACTYAIHAQNIRNFSGRSVDDRRLSHREGSHFCERSSNVRTTVLAFQSASRPHVATVVGTYRMRCHAHATRPLFFFRS